MHDRLAGLVKTLAFARKEIAEVLRQPRLVATLILGPFAILALFGVGYQRDTGPMRAVLVVHEDDAALRRELETRLGELGDAFVLQETTEDESAAVAAVQAGDADIAVIAPLHPYETVRGGEHAVFDVLHDTLDPFEQATIRLVSRAAIDTVNRELLTEAVATGQDESAEVAPLVAAARESATLLRESVERGDVAAAGAQRATLVGQLARLQAVVGPAAVLSRTLGTGLVDDQRVVEVGAELADLRTGLTAMEFGDDASPLADQVTEARSAEERLIELETALADFRRVEPAVLVSPLDVRTELVGAVSVDLTDFYAPGVIALLLQHLAITFASLSLVRERAMGTPEVFRVAPLGPTHILTGKYLGYTVGAGLVAAALSGLMLGVFGVPIAGSIVDYSVILLLLTAAALGVGFVISTFVNSDTQAVNVAMIVLMLSIFFSGFFLPLDRLLPEVRGVSWMLPITHALDSMRDVMFRGTGIDTRTWWALGLGAAALYVVAWWGLNRKLRSA